MRLRSLLLLTACSDPAGPGWSEVLDWPRTVRAGGLAYVVRDEPDASTLEASVDGRPLGRPWWWTQSGYGAVWTLPEDLEPGLAVLDFGGDPAPVEVIEPIFEEVSDEVGLDFVHEVDGWDPACAESMTGVGFADVDLDGDPDAFVGNLMGDGVLFLAEAVRGGLPTFADGTAGAGLAGHDLVTDVTFVDYDGDGDKDLFLGRRGANRLLRNEVVPTGVARFEDVSAEAGIGIGERRTTGAAFGDYDGDGDLDLYEVNHAWCFPDKQSGEPLNQHVLYRNDDGVFVDVTADLPDAYGEVSDRFGFAALWVDHDRDSDLDLFVFNDHVRIGSGGGVVFRNDGPAGDGWAFTSVGKALGAFPAPDALGKGINAMGAAIGDVDGDGSPDFAYSNIGPNFLVAGRPGEDGSYTFEDLSASAGIQRTLLPWEATSVTWGTHLFDAENDGDLDLLYVGGGLTNAAPQPHAYFENQGGLAYVDRTWEAGLDSPGHGKASAQVDLDGDGLLDLVIANWGGPLEVYRNRSAELGPRNHWLVVDLVGDGDVVAREAFGAIVALTPEGGRAQTCFRNPMPSMSGTGDPGCWFGLGGATAVDHLEVTWPDGLVQEVEVDGVDRRIEVIRAP